MFCFVPAVHAYRNQMNGFDSVPRKGIAVWENKV